MIISKYQEKFVYVKHKERDTLRFLEARTRRKHHKCAARELKEETGAKHFTLEPLFIYGLEKRGGRLRLVFEAQITDLQDGWTQRSKQSM